ASTANAWPPRFHRIAKMLELIAFLMWFGMTVAVASWAEQLNRHPLGWFAISLLLSPFFAILGLIAVGKRELQVVKPKPRPFWPVTEKTPQPPSPTSTASEPASTRIPLLDGLGVPALVMPNLHPP